MAAPERDPSPFGGRLPFGGYSGALLLAFALFIFLAGWLRATNCVKCNFDQWTLLYFVTAAVIALFPMANKLGFARDKDGGFSVNLDLQRSIEAYGIGGPQPASVATAAKEVMTSAIDPEDPHKGRWGGQSMVDGRRLIARLFPIANEPTLCRIDLEVRSIDPTRPLAGKVQFHLHPTFKDPDPVIFVVNGRAGLSLVAWGAFTVGAETEDGTRLELDMAEVGGRPPNFYGG